MSFVEGRGPAAAAAALASGLPARGSPQPEHAFLAVDGSVDATSLVDELGLSPAAEFDEIKLVCKKEHSLRRKCFSFYTGDREDSVESQLFEQATEDGEGERIRTEAKGSDLHVRVSTGEPADCPAIHFYGGGVMTLVPAPDYSTLCFVSSGPVNLEAAKGVAERHGCDPAKGFTFILPLPPVSFSSDTLLAGRAAGFASPFYGFDLALQLKSGWECGRAGTLSEYEKAMEQAKQGLEFQQGIWKRLPRVRPIFKDFALLFANYVDLRRAEFLSRLFSF